MSENCEAKLNQTLPSRVPRYGYKFQHVYYPLRFGPKVPSDQEWTLTILNEPDTGFFLGACLYNGTYNRGSYFSEGHRLWKLVLFDYPRGQEPCADWIMRAASSAIARLLGPSATVSHNTLTPRIIGDE